MPPTTLPLPDSTPLCVPYTQATPQQLSRALVYVMEELSEHFPTLSFGAWTTTLFGLKPDLWVQGTYIFIEEEDLIYLTQLLALAPELPTLDPPIYPDDSCYLSKRFVNYQDEALEALPEIAANPRAYSARVFELVASLAIGNSVAEMVYRATYRGPKGRPGSPDPALARATVHEQVRALRRARGEVGHQEVPEFPQSPAKHAAPGK
jgi:hypothetical protein